MTRPLDRPHRRTTTRRRSRTPTSTARWRPPTRCGAARRGTSARDDLVALSPDEAGRLAADLAAAGRLDTLALVVSCHATAPLPARRPADRCRVALPVERRPPWRARPGGGPGAAAAAALGARRGRRRSRRSARCSPRSPPCAPSSRPAPPYRWWGAPGDDDGRAARQRRRSRRRRMTDETVFRGRRDDPQVLRPPRRRRDRAPRRGGGRPALRGHPRPPVTARTAAWSPARRWSCRSARPSSSTSCCSTTRRRSRSPAARARASPSPTCALPDGDDDVHREVRRGARARAPARAPGVARRPGRRGRLAHDRRRRDSRRGRRGDGAGATRRRAARPRPAAGRAAAGPGRLGVPRRRRQHVLRLDGVRRRPGRARPGPAEHQHPRRRHRRRSRPRPGGRSSSPPTRARTTSAWPAAPGSIARAIPQGVQEALRAVVEAPGRTSAPAVLLLTEELDDPVGARVPRPRPDEHRGAGRRPSSARTPPSRAGR